MNSFLNWLFSVFTVHDDTTRILLMAFLVLCLFSLVLRIVLSFGYQAQATIFHFQAKPLKAKPDLKNFKSGLLSRVVREYIQLAEKNIVNIDVEALTARSMLQFHFLGWAYKSMERFVTGFEQGLVLIGILLAVLFPEDQYAFGVLTIAAFLILKLGESIFDFKLSSDKLSADMTCYITREVGQFYGSDSSSHLLHLKSELSAALAAQSEAMDKSIEKLAENVGGALRLSMQELTSRLNDSMGQLEKPLEDWRRAIAESETAQLKIHGLLQDAGALSVQQISHKELQYIETNQQQLEKTMQLFELSLETLTQKLGDALGSMMEYQTRSAFASLNEDLQDNIKQITNSNRELMTGMQGLFEGLLTQSREQAQATIKIKEQMDFQFENLRSKLGLGEAGPWI